MNTSNHYGVYMPREEFYREREDLLEEDVESGDRCVYCGYPILRGEDKLRVEATGDIIHRKCWNDYAEDNVDELCTPLDSIYGEEWL